MRLRSGEFGGGNRLVTDDTVAHQWRRFAQAWLKPVCGGLAAAVLTSAATPGAAASPPALEFMPSVLGLSRQAWKATPPPGDLSPNARAVCSDESPTGAAVLAPIAAKPAAGLVVCGYVNSYGAFNLPTSFPLDGGRRLSRLRFVFAGDRLVEVRGRAPVDAYADLVAWLKARYGPAKTISHKQAHAGHAVIPTVEQTWDTPFGRVVLKDPVAPYDELSLAFISRSAASQGQAAPLRPRQG
jgi:hypothetical protein